MTLPREVLATLLSFLDSFWLEHGFGPTTRDLQRGLGLSSTSVAWYQARAAARRGWLEWEPGLPRTMRLTAAGRAMVRGNGQDLATWLLSVERLLGEVAALQPNLEIFLSVNLNGSRELPPFALAAWLLKIKGLVAELPSSHHLTLEVIGRTGARARFETKGGSLAEEEG